jgi:hypothetical protein
MLTLSDNSPAAGIPQIRSRRGTECFTGPLRPGPGGMGVVLLYMGLPGSYTHAVRVAATGQDFTGAGILGAVQVLIAPAGPAVRVRSQHRLG